MSEGVCEAGGCPEGGGSYRLHHDYLRVPVPLEMWRSRRYCVLSGCLDPCLAGTVSALCLSGYVSDCACDCLAVHLAVLRNCLLAFSVLKDILQYDRQHDKSVWTAPKTILVFLMIL